ncbi:M24 family metallopeptidase [Candidatus Gracilibacteria bacterium]|nr:M24 family metallopeptidase [Candidatus Gracilibacteria bacterium]
MHLIINPTDIYYLTGVRSHDPGEILIIYDENNQSTILCDLRTSALFGRENYQICDQRSEWGDIFARYAILDTDPDFLTQTLRKKIEAYGVRLSSVKSPITRKRVIKTQTEIELLQTSQKLNKNVYERILPFLIPGVTENEIARKIQILQLELGASGSSFPPIVAFGENSAVPHHSPTERKLRPEDIILLDMGLVYQGYCSDMTRMVYQENIPDEARKIGELVTWVTDEIITWAKPGMKAAELDRKARELLGEYEKYFTHSLGHGVGLDIHEAPHVSSKSDEILEPGMIITIEPGIYIAGEYGARYEEMCLVSKEGMSLF